MFLKWLWGLLFPQKQRVRVRADNSAYRRDR